MKEKEKIGLAELVTQGLVGALTDAISTGWRSILVAVLKPGLNRAAAIPGRRATRRRNLRNWLLRARFRDERLLTRPDPQTNALAICNIQQGLVLSVSL